MTRMFAPLALAGSSAVLGAALLSQYIGGLAPCPMCIWQRWPHVVAIAALMVGLFILRAQARTLFLIAGVALLVGAGIGVFHAGVEWDFWEGPSSCSGGDISKLSTEQLLDQILNAPLVRCDEIPWSFLGLSMAGWNAVCSAILALLALIAARRQA